ncbi:Spo0E like sporulation regulatory protein [Anaerobacterium chartisolvens]|uniref:Spo0E like sporulation regulatory protein n=1 Tax=Anaerobacterium chartisolvens TaxID=1297424 RepID=A0A369B8U8_9FIRM|nr:aspartyl-phosphate phosphatase Spo0E family protein [Anaerobacterium chartisolvens]RCX17953.1 Spo0E like sporulation regulatory protein [Anaerobacterium chartisolvens]
MSHLERVRQELYKSIESGNAEEILKISRELDKIILIYMGIEESGHKMPA